METLDIIIATYNRSTMLRRCLESIFNARPITMEWRVTVVDNNSRDDTRDLVNCFVQKHGARVNYLFEERQGKSAALNSAITASHCSLIGIIDDDEQISEQWLEIVERFFQDEETDYIGGSCLGLWCDARPKWLPRGYDGVLSASNRDQLPQSPVPFGGPDLFLQGGNSVFRRSVFEKVGLYERGLGPVGPNMGSCEDHDMFSRLLAAGLKGIYVPDLIIYHAIPRERLTRRYFRRWVWGHAVSLAQMNSRLQEKVAYIGRIPRYRIGAAIRWLPGLLNSDPAMRFSAELRWWELLGFVYGAYLCDSPPITA
jgi:glycosyltransferase involved in cell wall biosynthesis